MSRSALWRSAALPAAAGSLVSLAAQGLMALGLLHLFDAAAVGRFSLIAQVAFGWATLALAQSPLSLLANQAWPARPAARQALHTSLRRWLWLCLPAALALAWAVREQGPWLAALLWSAAIALAQMGWLLAQSLTLRLHGGLSIAMVRLLPPVLAAALVATAAWGLEWRSSQALTAAALAGYAAGALWLTPLWGVASTPPEPWNAAPTDTRSERLKFIHTLSDVAVATALAAHWSALYGAAQAGALLLLLRLTGFVPALVSTAWAQVVLSRPQARRPSSLLAALAGVAAVGLMGLSVRVALQAGWLAPGWHTLADCLWPVCLWQMAACLMAAVSHRPWPAGRAVTYTRQCLAINAVQAALLLLPPWLGIGLAGHLWLLAGWLGLALSVQALWAARLPRPAPVPT